MRNLKWSAIVMALVLLVITVPVYAGTADEEEKDYLEGVHLVYLGADYFAGEGSGLPAQIAELEAGTYEVDAVEGSCIAGTDETTYASRTQNLEQLRNTGDKIKNMLVVELTDNDLDAEYALGEWDYVYDAEYDTTTIIGALDNLFQQARNLEMLAALLIPAGQDHPEFPVLVEAAEALQEKWGYVIIDLRETEGQDAAESAISQIRPFLTVMRASYKNMFKYAGNLPQFDPANYDADPDSPLKGLNIIQLGSSVTEGTGSDEGISFVEYIAQMTGSTYIKEAEPGTTMSNYAPLGDTSYIYRMEHEIDPEVQADLFLCQLSTNDASKRVEVGEVSDSDDPADFNLETVAGATEYIIHFVQDTWGCPVMFYTGTEYSNAAYGDMVDMLLTLQDKYEIGIIDMYHNLSTDTPLYNQYMSPDGIHPTKRGYAEWWAPYMIEQITEYLGAQE